MSFNLTESSWIQVVGRNLQMREISLIELLQNWTELQEILGDNPPTILALYRFIIALLHYVYQGPTDREHWEEIRADNGQRAIDYLKAQRDLFDLLHPNRPFMQDPTIASENAAEIYQAYVLHGNNTSTVFCHEHQWSSASLSLAAAARLVLRLQLFDVGGRKTGSSISAGVIPTMNAANILVRGDNLKETLLLNMMQYDAEDDMPCVVNGEDLPAWERANIPATGRIPTGYIDYLTFQWRRVKIFCDDEKATKIAFHPGDSLPKTSSAEEYDCGIAYKKTSKGNFSVNLNLKRLLWRDSIVFLQSSDVGNCPRIIEWFYRLKFGNLKSIDLQIIGLTVDNAKPLGWTIERFSAPIDYLHDNLLWDALKTALKIAEDHQEVFRAFKGSPYQALAEVIKYHEVAGLAASLDGESRYWMALDRLFKPLLKDLLNDRTEDLGGIRYGDRVLPQWKIDVQNVATTAFTQSIEAIRNYEARAKALNCLGYRLAKLRGDKEKKAKQKENKSTKKLTIEPQQLSVLT